MSLVAVDQVKLKEILVVSNLILVLPLGQVVEVLVCLLYTSPSPRD